MKKSIFLLIVLMALAITSFGAVVSDFAITSGTKAMVYDQGDAIMPWQVSTTDLINGVTATNLTLVGGGFHPATQPTDATARLNVLTNGTWDTNGVSVICNDMDGANGGNAALIVEYAFTPAKHIGEIRIFSGHADSGGGRVWINCNVEVDSGSGYQMLFEEFKTGHYGLAVQDNTWSAVGALRMYQNAGNNVAVNVQKIKFSFYDVSHNDNPTPHMFRHWNDTEGGRPKPNQGTILKEIDILEGVSSEKEWTIY